ncbi:hypothetical protein [Alteromonas sp. P256]|jgi:hypothetical protein|uniref:hypothetical protein n=1 Tax=Alteromonas sp. P256 TaxID=3117399 RepID=UPI002FE3A52E
MLELASAVHALAVLNHAMPKPTDGILEAILHKPCLEAPEIHAACNCGQSLLFINYVDILSL